MIDDETFKRYFAKFKPSLDSIIQFAKFSYDKASFRNGKLLSTDYFIKIVKAVAVRLNLSPQQIQAIQFKLYDTIKSYRTRDGQKVRVAELKSPILIRALVRDLWFSTKTYFRQH